MRGLVEGGAGHRYQTPAFQIDRAAPHCSLALLCCPLLLPLLYHLCDACCNYWCLLRWMPPDLLYALPPPPDPSFPRLTASLSLLPAASPRGHSEKPVFMYDQTIYQLTFPFFPPSLSFPSPHAGAPPLFESDIGCGARARPTAGPRPAHSQRNRVYRDRWRGSQEYREAE